MIDKKQLTEFLLKARANTYAGNIGEVTALLEDSKQFEYKENDLLYRDIYNQGNKRFAGLETIYLKNKSLWTMSYYGNFEKMSEKETYKILRKALIDKKDKVRLWNKVSYKIKNFLYTNNGSGSINELDGSEKIKKDGKTVYFFYYAGGFIG